MQLPDYQGGSIVNLMASLQMGLGGDLHDYPPLRLLPPDRLDQYRQVVLWVIDGLGYDYLRAHPAAVHLNAALHGCMTSVYPPTTASAITTFLTGDAPQQHGLTGWFVYFRELGSILSVLPGRARYGGVAYGSGGVNAAELLNHTPFSHRIGVESFNLSPSHIVDSEFNRAHLGSSKQLGYHSLQELCDCTLEIARKPGRRYLYLYWPELDSIGHRSGIWSEEAGRHLLELDRAFHDLSQGLKGSDTLLILCADHGQIDSLPAQTLILSQYPALSQSLVMPLCGEPRSAYCYLRSGAEACFEDALAQLPEGLCSSTASVKLIEEGWYGLGEPHPHLLDRVGDRVILLQKQAVILDWLSQEKPYQMIGVHGGLSSAELWVPLILMSC
jgi:hypothetical protein